MVRKYGLGKGGVGGGEMKTKRYGVLNGVVQASLSSNTNTNEHGDVDGGIRRAGGASEEDVAAERTALLAEKQAELDGVLDRHDDMVREVFHLEKFVTLLGYDPRVAKQDDSVVFQEYKSKYDLLEQAAASAGPSRATRRAHTQRVLNLTASSPAKPPHKNRPANPHPAAAPLPLDLTSPASMPLSSKAKGKQKMVDVVDVPPPTPITNGKPTRSKPRTIPMNLISSDDAPASAPGASGGSAKAGGSNAKLQKKRSSLNMTSPASSPVPRKKRKAQGVEPPGESISASQPSRRSVRNDGISTPSISRLALAPSATTSTPTRTIETRGPPLDLTRTSSIKRIRLIVRKPPPTYTSPLQRPAPPRFGSSVSAFLSSYTSYNDQDLNEEGLAGLASEEARLRERVARLRKEGRFFGGSGSLQTGGSASMSGKSTPSDPRVHEPHDAWSHVVSAIVSRGKSAGHTKGRHVAAQIASRVQAYWDQSAVREDKAKAAEEKRVRALAKATVRIVVGEWKKAVFYIREQERARLEAEEMRRGHEHLDAILDQSGQILETQHVELAKRGSRSRSSSVSGVEREWEEGGTSDEEGEGDEEEGGEESAEEFAGIEMEEEGAGTGTGGGKDEDGTIDGGDDGDESEGSSDEEDGETTHALLGRSRHRDDDPEPETPAAEVPTSDQPTELDWADDHGSAHGDQTPSELSIDHDPHTEDLELRQPHSSVVLEEPAGSPSIPSDLDSAVRTPTYGDGHSPVFYDFSMQDTPSPASSIIGHETGQEGKDDGDTVPDIEGPAQSTLFAPASDRGIATKASPPADEIPDDEAIQEDKVDSTPHIPHSPLPEDTSTPKPQPTDEPMEDIQSEESVNIPEYLKPFAVAPVDWSPEDKIKPPLLLRGVLRPYQQSGLEWLASLHSNNLNGILADEMGLGKTIQTISLLAHLACDRGIWGPHLIIVPTSVLLNWEMEFKKFLPGFKILSYHGTTKRRKELRQGWYNKHHFNVCITSYTLASRDAHIFKRKMWYYMILDEAHMIKNFKSQRWNILLMFRSFRRLLLTGTPLQNNLTELWALLQFLMSGRNFANLKEFGEWFSNPLEKAIEMGTMLDDETLQRVSKLHTVLRPYLLRRLKRDVEKELPSKYEHLVLCPLSKRQRFLYDEFMARAHTREALQSGVYQKIANILMQLRKVCNHPDLFEVRPVVTSFAMARSAVADFEIKELLVRRQLLRAEDEDRVNLDLFGFRFVAQQDIPLITALETRRLDATHRLPLISEIPGEPPPQDTRTIAGWRAWRTYQQRAQKVARWAQIGYVNGLRCARMPIYGQELLTTVQKCSRSILPSSAVDLGKSYMDTATTINAMVKSHVERAEELSGVIDKFAFATPAVVALDLPRLALSGCEEALTSCSPGFDSVVHQPSVKLQIAFPDPSLLQYDCGKLQELSRLLRQKKAEGHRILIFTQMTRILDILEIFLNFHGYLYLRLDGATKIEDRQYITERFNADARIFCFISSSRSGGVGINLTGADTVIFYDSDFNPQMDRQCEDRAHRIGQIRDVHIYRFISSHTVEEAMLMKANQKRSLDDLVIQKGEFDWRTLFEDDGALTKALGEFEDMEDAHAAAIAAREEDVLEGADQADFGAEGDVDIPEVPTSQPNGEADPGVQGDVDGDEGEHAEDGEGGGVSDYMISFVRLDYEFFRDWRL